MSPVTNMLSLTNAEDSSDSTDQLFARTSFEERRVTDWVIEVRLK